MGNRNELEIYLLFDLVPQSIGAMERLKPKPSFKAPFLLILGKKVCLKRTSCLEVILAQLHLCKSAVNHVISMLDHVILSRSYRWPS